MATLLTNKIASMTEMREPHKVLERSGGQPVAILKNSALVGYFVPASAVTGPEETEIASLDEVRRSLATRKQVTEPVREYLRDK
jgi:antitoxin StbD